MAVSAGVILLIITHVDCYFFQVRCACAVVVGTAPAVVDIVVVAQWPINRKLLL